MAAVYNRAVYPADKRRALVLWAERLEAAIEGREPTANVVSLSARSIATQKFPEKLLRVSATGHYRRRVVY